MKSIKIVLAFFLVICSVSCTQDKSIKQYNELVKKEKTSGKRVDSIFFGIYLGMSNKDFFSHCWELNKKGIFFDGMNNTAVLYKLNNNELKYPASMNFYPDFNSNKIYKMRVSFQYNAWAPWNKQLYADSLLPHVLNLYKKWYSQGNAFIKMDDKDKGTIYIKVDGNRRITIGKSDDTFVKADYTDLSSDPQEKR